MSDTEARNTDVVRRYFDGCNTGDLQRLLETLAPDVVHYFLPARYPPVRGAEALARFWQRSRERFGSRWTVDRVVAQGDEVVVEWSLFWKPKDRHIVTRGTDWYLMRDARVAEIRAYFAHEDAADTELAGFPYRERGYPAPGG